MEDESLSLNEAASRALLSGLRTHLAVSDEAEDGDYLTLRLSEAGADVGDADPAAVAQAILGVLSLPEVADHVSGLELTAELAGAFRGAIRLREMRDAVASLRTHLEEGGAANKSTKTGANSTPGPSETPT